MEKVEIVRCKNCQHAKWDDTGWMIYCTYGLELFGSKEVDEEFYCSYGEYDEDKAEEQYRYL